MLPRPRAAAVPFKCRVAPHDNSRSPQLVREGQGDPAYTWNASTPGTDAVESTADVGRQLGSGLAWPPSSDGRPDAWFKQAVRRHWVEALVAESVLDQPVRGLVERPLPLESHRILRGGDRYIERGAVDGTRTAAETTSAGNRIAANCAWLIALPPVRVQLCQPAIARTHSTRLRLNPSAAATPPSCPPSTPTSVSSPGRSSLRSAKLPP